MWKDCQALQDEITALRRELHQIPEVGAQLPETAACLSAHLDRLGIPFVRSPRDSGLIASIQKVTDRYAATTGATKGILIEKAGSKYSPSAALNNTLLEQMKDIDKQVDKWQAKMSDKVDYYTNKFTQLEMLIAQMNSQSSSLAGMMGGY